MIAFILVVVCLASFIAGWLIADSITEKRFWKRQNYMEKLNRRF